MAVKNIVLVRHGRTAYNAAMRLQGQVDIPLDDIGRWQAAEAAKVLAQSPLATPFILASDLERARDTARVIGDALGVEVHTDARLRERGFGPGKDSPAQKSKRNGQDSTPSGLVGENPTLMGWKTKTLSGNVPLTRSSRSQTATLMPATLWSYPTVLQFPASSRTSSTKNPPPGGD